MTGKKVSVDNKKVDEAVDLMQHMAKLLRIEPQLILEQWQARLGDRMKEKHDPDIEAIVEETILPGGGFYVR